MAITLTQIRAFLAVKSAGSVHAAAGQLMVSQPSVSAAVASLARELGTALFERHGRGVRLTESGEAFAPYAAQVLGLLEQGRNAAREAAHPESSKIRLIAVNTAGEYLVPPLIRAYRQLHPGINILLEVGNRATVFERLESRRADIGIGGRPPGRSLVGYPFLPNELRSWAGRYPPTWPGSRGCCARRGRVPGWPPSACSATLISAHPSSAHPSC